MPAVPLPCGTLRERGSKLRVASPSRSVSPWEKSWHRYARRRNSASGRVGIATQQI
ncbi:MAG: hypothetical protein V7L00_03690 [Nostoc sp.]|uniref:hypothetical protein n=1 Tax=Nostoc sp. TaxID=1180 RepID=UPI002FFA4AE2